MAGPESANNASAQASFIPMLTLGLPSTPSTAVLLGALFIFGVIPGPLLMKQHPEIFWGAVTSMYTGNLMLLVLNLPLIPMWVRVLKVPYHILFPLILMFCITGAFSIDNSFTDILVMNIFGIIGYLMKKVDYEGAPMILAFVLGPMFENALRQSLMLSKGSFLIFLVRPISLGFLIAAAMILISPLILKRRLELGLAGKG